MTNKSTRRPIRLRFILGSLFFWLFGFVVGLYIAYGKEAAVKHNFEVAMSKIAWQFASKASAEGDVDAIRHLRALSRQTMLPRLAKAAERELALLRERAAEEEKYISPAVIKALAEVEGEGG